MTLLEDIVTHPYTGIGKPETLKYELAGIGHAESMPNTT